MRDYKKLFESGTKAQLEKLKQNDHKDHWSKLSISSLYFMLTDEKIELGDEVHAQVKDYSKIRHEAADVANFAHMIIDICDKLMEGENGNSVTET